MADILDRLRGSLRFDAVNGDAHERSVCASQMKEAVAELASLRAQLADVTRERDEARALLRDFSAAWGVAALCGPEYRHRCPQCSDLLARFAALGKEGRDG